MTAQDTIEIGVTEFKAKCLKLISDLNEGRLREIILTRRGEEVARMQRPKPKTPPKPLYGSMRGSVVIHDEFALTGPIYSDEEWEEIEAEWLANWDELLEPIEKKTGSRSSGSAKR